jgi:hypothetical protein
MTGGAHDQPGVVRFRVNSFEPNPLPAPLGRPGEWLLAVHLDMPGDRRHINYPMMFNEFEPHLDAIREAIETQSLYWVDWDFSSQPNLLPDGRTNSADRRVLQALSNRQIVPRAEGGSVGKR